MNKSAEVDATRTMIDRVENKFDIRPERLVGDTNYGSAAILGWLVDEKQIEPHVPVLDKSVRADGTFSRTDFAWREKANEHRCPAEKALRCVATDARSKIRAHGLPKQTPSSIARVHLTAPCAQ